MIKKKDSLTKESKIGKRKGDYRIEEGIKKKEQTSRTTYLTYTLKRKEAKRIENKRKSR